MSPVRHAAAGVWAALVVLGACRKAAPGAQLDFGNAPEAETQTAARWVEGGNTWRSSADWCLEIPEGWRARDTVDGGVELEQPSDGLRGAVRPIDNPEMAQKAPAGWQLVFLDDDSYRAVPRLERVGSATWVTALPDGPTRHAWWGNFAGHWLTLEVEIPAGRGISGRLDAQTVLDGLCRYTLNPTTSDPQESEAAR